MTRDRHGNRHWGGHGRGGGNDPDPSRWRYASAIFATTDGGANWTRLTDPRPPSASPQMYTVDARTVVLLSEPDGRLNQVGPAGMRCDDGCHLTVRGSRVGPGPGR